MAGEEIYLDYSEPVSQLLTLGECRDIQGWPDYLALGIGPEHTADLIRMVQDDELNWADSESLEVWTPVHAWRALGQLRAEAAVEPLLGLLWRIDVYSDDSVGEEIPVALGMIGPAAVPKLAEYLAAPQQRLWARVAVAHALSEVGKRYPEARDDCVAALTGTLEGFVHDPTLNGSLISSLVDLEAVEAAPVMEKAFAADCVELSILGDWEDVQIELGLLEERQTPAPESIRLPEISPLGPGQQTRITRKPQSKRERDAQRRRRQKHKQQKREQKKQKKRK